MIRNCLFPRSRLALVSGLLLSVGVPTAMASSKPQVVAKWGRFEQTFKSDIVYSNAVQDASLKAVFTSPLGETNEAEGFWDGGRTWRVRFSPDQPGRWKFRTTCSDESNDGLHHQTGEFICTAATGQTRFHKHGQVRVALNHRHLEHADGTPFFWLADTVWTGARKAEPKDWQLYVETRARQRFTVAQWAVAPGEDLKEQSAWTGPAERIAINPDFFERLDAKLTVLSQAGILSAIVPLLELPAETSSAQALPDDQAELFVRYVVARWGADPVAWLIAFQGDAAAKGVARWKRIGQAVFGARAHAPVVLFAGETPWLLDEFRAQQWVDAFGFQSVTDLTDDALKWTFSGPFATEWNKDPIRPLIAFAPCENNLSPRFGKRFSADDVRHAVYWSLLMTAPAGVSYRALSVADWNTSVISQDEEIKGAEFPLWRKALFMPAAKQMSYLAKLMTSIDFWKLRPQPGVVGKQPGAESPRRFIASASTDPNTLSLIYVPEDRTLEVPINALPPSPSVGWFNPRTGENNPAVAVVGGSSCQFPTPEAGDWVLQIKAGK